MITPFAALDPKIAVAEPSFNTSIFSISFGLISPNAFELVAAAIFPEINGTPSTTIKGDWFCETEFTPRILILAGAPTSPPPETT